MEEIITDTLIEIHFDLIREHLIKDTSRIPFQLSREWCRSFPNESGVYCFFINDKLSYVGETECLRKRLADLLDTRNHTLRRTIGEKYFFDIEGYKKATSQSKFSDHIEIMVQEWISTNLKVSMCLVKIGRKEFEEWLQNKHPEIKFLNKRKKRPS
jgi:hypothetical protein